MFNRIKSNPSAQKVKQVEDHGKKGQGLTEFALILPVLLLVILGIIEAAWIIWAYITVQNAAREAARYAVTGQPLDSQGEPWNEIVFPNETRSEAIKQVARDAAGGLPIDVYADQAIEGQDYESTQYANLFDRPRALGILIRGQSSPDDLQGTINHPGLKGLNISVEVYYNANLLDPLYNAVMGGRAVHLSGRVVLQNEGVNLALGGEVPEFAPPQGDTSGSGGTQGLFEEIEVRYEGQVVNNGDVPAGGDVDLYLKGHTGGTTYYVCFDGTPIPESPVSIYPNNTYLITAHNIPLSTSPVPGTHTFTSSLNPDCSDPAAAASINVVDAISPAITISDVGHAKHAWPDNSLVAVRLSAHDPNQVYDVFFDSALMPVGDGSANTCQITTDGSGTGLATCAIPDGLVANTYTMSSTFATNSVDVINASINVQGGDEWPDGATVQLVLDEHAPGHSYHIYADSDEIPASQPDGISTNSGGQQVIYYQLPTGYDGVMTLQTQDKNDPLPPSTVRQIATTVITVTSSTEPMITVVGGYDWPAGEVIQIELHNHSPNTTYDVKFGEDVGVGEAMVGTVTTNGDGDFFGVLAYKIPVTTPSSVRKLISYLQSTTTYSATRDLTIRATPTIDITDGNKHVPQAEITINLNGHAANTSYDVYLDLNGDGSLTADELIEENIVTDGSGYASFEYTIPADIMPRGLDAADAHQVVSKRNSDDVAETDLFVVDADLTVTAITPPTDPQPGVDLPIALTIRNNAAITLTGFPFDNDLFVNPEPAPNYIYTLPPGDEKVWISTIGPQQSVVITPVVNIYNMGTYTLYGKTDASNGVAESLETNNILSDTMSVACNLATIEDNFDGSQQGNWTMTTFGSANYGPWASLQSEPTELLAMAHVVDADALRLALPPALPVLRATPQPVVIEAEEVSAKGNAYKVEPAVFKAEPPAMPQQQATNTVEVRVSDGDDDAEERVSNGSMSRNSSDLELVNDNGHDQIVGIRFPGVAVPSGATIYDAYIEFEVDEEQDADTSLTIYGQADGNPAQFSNWSHNISNRSKTSASVSWDDLPEWNVNENPHTPGLAGIVQEIVNRGDWASGHAMAFIIEGSGRRTFESYNGETSGAPLLHIEYATGPVNTPTPTATPTPDVPSNCDNPLTGPVTTFSSSEDVGSPLEGFSGQSGSTVYVCGSGNDIWGNADSFRYAYNTATGDLDLTARVVEWNGQSNEWSKAGLMIRSSNAANSAHAMVVVTRDHDIRMQWRSSDGSSSGNSSGASFSVPVWLRLVKTGNTISAYYSTNGSSWTQVGSSQTITLGSNYLWGLAVTSHNTGDHASARFDNISATGGPAPTSTPTPTNTPVGGSACGLGDVFQESSSQVVMEAEHFGDTQAGSSGAASHNWQTTTSVSGYSGTSAMQALPNSNPGVNTGLNTYGPALLYQINFSTAGVYNVYVRGYGSSNNDDSVHVGLDGNAVTTENIPNNTGLTGFYAGQFVWSNSYDGKSAQITVPSTGVHTFYVWMREDGTVIDKIVLKQASGAPSGTGPAESSCAAVPTPTPTSTPTTTPTPDSSYPAPTNLSATADTDAFGSPVINLSWQDNSSNEDGFIIERSLDGGTTWTQIATTGANATTYVDSSVTCNTTYTYRVRAFRSGGPISLPSNTASATTSACLTDQCDSSVMNEGLTLCSSGTSATQNDDNNGGYLFMNQAINSYSFDMVVRLNSVPGMNGQSRAGFEVRETLGSTAKKVDLVIRNQNTQEVGAFSRSADGGAVAQVGGWTDTGGDVPTWLRIVRANGSFSFYYNTRDEEMPVLGAWTLVGTAQDTMGMNVRVGLINVSASSGRDASTWEQFRIGCLPETVARDTCGAVTEENGTAVINAINYTDNFVSKTSSDTWRETSRSGYPAMYYNGSNYERVEDYAWAPMLEYAVNIERSDTYYVWLLGYSPNDSGDSIHLGLDGARIRAMEDQNGSGLRWFNTNESGGSVTLNLSQGVHVINIWGREDDFELLQIMLTNRPPSTYAPSDPVPFGQSDCLVPVPPEFPPNLQQCTLVLQNPGFETGSPSQGNFVWVPGQSEEQKAEHGGVWAYPLGASGSSFGIRMKVEPLYKDGPVIQPYLYQSFNMPDWILPSPDTTAKLTLYKAVDQLRNPSYFEDDSPGDKVYVVLRNENGVELTNPVALANGADTPDADDFLVDKWVSVEKNLIDNFTGDPVDTAGKQLQTYIYGQTGPGNETNDPGSTRFHIDEVQLEICTKQPEPAAESDKGNITGQLAVFNGGVPQPVQGVAVWAYKVDGAMHTTYTVNAPAGSDNYSFYNLDPGVYIVYAKFVNSSGQEFGASTSINVVANQTSHQNLLLVLGGS